MSTRALWKVIDQFQTSIRSYNGQNPKFLQWYTVNPGKKDSVFEILVYINL